MIILLILCLAGAYGSFYMAYKNWDEGDFALKEGGILMGIGCILLAMICVAVTLGIESPNR